MSLRRQPFNKLERYPWSRVKLLVNWLQKQILSIQQDTIRQSLRDCHLLALKLWMHPQSSTHTKGMYAEMASTIPISSRRIFLGGMAN